MPYASRFDEPIDGAALTPREQQEHDEYVDRELHEMMEADGISEGDDLDADAAQPSPSSDRATAAQSTPDR